VLLRNLEDQEKTEGNGKECKSMYREGRTSSAYIQDNGKPELEVFWFFGFQKQETEEGGEKW